MKRIIALALSILLGSTGYVIVDHTIEDRVGVLESQVESLNGVVSSLEDKHQTMTFTIPTMPTVPSYPLFKDGDKIPVSDLQKYSFDMIHYTGYNFFDGIKGNKFTAIRGKENTNGYGDVTDIEHISDFELTLDNISFICIDENNVSTTRSPNGYIQTKPYRPMGVKVDCNGKVPAEYAGKKIYFCIRGNTNLSEPSDYTSVINADGSFFFEGYFFSDYTVAKLELIDPVIY